MVIILETEKQRQVALQLHFAAATCLFTDVFNDPTPFTASPNRLLASVEFTLASCDSYHSFTSTEELSVKQGIKSRVLLLHQQAECLLTVWKLIVKWNWGPVFKTHSPVIQKTLSAGLRLAWQQTKDYYTADNVPFSSFVVQFSPVKCVFYRLCAQKCEWIRFKNSAFHLSRMCSYICSKDTGSALNKS